MNNVIHKTTRTCAGLLLAFACGTPAVADDTELLLVNPDAAQQLLAGKGCQLERL